jgi:colanic acid/amylovoran biosynthesis glycosyltransferase
LPAPIAYLLGRYPTVSNTFVYREIAQLRAAGQAVDVYALSGSDDPCHRILEAGEVRRVPSAHAVVRRQVIPTAPAEAWRSAGGRQKDLRRAGWLADRWARDGVKVVHVHFLGTAAALAAVACEAAKIPLVVSVHARGILVPDRLTHFTLERVAQIRTISERTSALVESESGLASQVVPLAVESASLSPPSDEPLHVLTVARPVAKKGYPVMRAAMAALGSAARWTVVGATESDVGGPMPGLHAHGVVPFSDLEAIYEQGVDAFALPCQIAPDHDEDGIPVAILEAMARGVPVVTTPVGGIPELIQDGVSGRLVPPENSEALAEALRGLMSAPTTRTKLGLAGRAQVRETRRPSVQARALLQLLQQAAHG